jgi:SAM-dependent methyltransferase
MRPRLRTFIARSSEPPPASAEPPSPDPIERWLTSHVPGRTFADIGGIGMSALNERVSLALKAGATRAAMVDLRPSDYVEWKQFRERCAAEGVSGYEEFSEVDINDPALADKIGSYDVVNCTGIFYHLPSPVNAFENLREVVGEYLVVNTVTVPERIENSAGALEFHGSVALFLPGIDEHEREVLRKHYGAKFEWSIDDVAPLLHDQTMTTTPWREDGGLSCWPYWWLFSDTAFRGLVRLMGFEILDEWKWEDHALAVLARKAADRD